MGGVRTHRVIIGAAIFGLLLGSNPGTQHRVDLILARGGLPAHIAASFSEPTGFQRSSSGDSYVFDPREHTVYRIDADASEARKIVQIGQEEGRILQPGAFDMAPDGTFVVADAPNNRERIQIFSPAGTRLGGFVLPGTTSARVSIGGLVLNGVGSLQYTGKSILINEPERGGLITEYRLTGAPTRTFGTLRATGHETDRELHLMLNAGLPLANPKGGFYFVFQTGRPLLRKYTTAGTLVFERHIEGPELDPIISTLPDVWPLRSTAEGTLPLVPPTIRTATVDPDGHVWVGLTGPSIYEYDEFGDKVRTVQFKGTSLITPTSLFFVNRRRVLVTPGCYEFDVR
jgi:hypothetical protein